MYNLFKLGTTLLFLSYSSAEAEIERKDASYFCVAEAAGGLAFNAGLKKWVGSVFKPTENFVLHLKFIDVQQGRGNFDKDETYSNFDVSLTPSGSKSNIKCT